MQCSHEKVKVLIAADAVVTRRGIWDLKYVEVLVRSDAIASKANFVVK
jgi:hypothetical protein